MTPNNEEVKAVEKEPADEVLVEASKELAAVLEKHSVGIQPFLRVTASGITPDAKLVRVKYEPKTGSAGDGGASQKKAPNPKPKKS